MDKNKIFFLFDEFVIRIFAVIFIIAAIPKITAPDTFADAIASFRMTPAWLIEPLAYFLPWFEGICALLLLIGIFKEFNYIVLSGLLILYTFLALIAIFREIDIHCGCFGGEGGTALHVVVRNILILLSFNSVRFVIAKKQLKNEI